MNRAVSCRLLAGMLPVAGCGVPATKNADIVVASVDAFNGRDFDTRECEPLD